MSLRPGSRWATRGIAVVTPPTAEPFDVEAAKAHLRVTHTRDDDYIGDLVTAARVYIEQQGSLALPTQTLDVALERFPCGDVLRLPIGPIQSVTSITSYDRSNNPTVVTASDYWLDTSPVPPEIILADGLTWPTDLRTRKPGVVRVVAGYGDAAGAVPMPLKLAMKQLIAHWYETRSPVGTLTAPMGFTVDALLAPYRVLVGVA